MNVSAKIRQFGTVMTIVGTLLLAACDSAIYDYEGDCSVTYRLRFRYDMNMAFADAFAHEVTSVSVYAFNPEGVLVWQKSEKGDILKAGSYAMPLELPAGSYDLIAWCGLSNDGVRAESFTVPEMTVGASRKEQLTCALNRKHTAEGQAYTDEDLYRLYHGALSVDLLDEDSPEAVPGIYELTMPLVKNTNRVRIILQQLSGEDVNPDDFTFCIEEENGWMNYDNSLLPDEPVIYRQWQTQTGEAGVGTDAVKSAVTQVKVAIADLTVGRMMADRRMMLTIAKSRSGEVLVRIPLTDYALLVKDNYETVMTNQEYLDRQDQFTLTFFLGDNNKWISSVIEINGWRIVNNDMEL